MDLVPEPAAGALRSIRIHDFSGTYILRVKYFQFRYNIDGYLYICFVYCVDVVLYASHLATLYICTLLFLALLYYFWNLLSDILMKAYK